MKMNRERFEKILEEYYSHSPPTKFVLAVDFDHTLCYSHYPFCGKETPVASFVRSIQDMGIVLIINTCREKGMTALAAKKWLKRHGIKYDYYNCNASDNILFYGNCRKIACNMSIDDTDYNFCMNDFVEEEC